MSDSVEPERQETFEKPDIDIGVDDIVCFFKCHNEANGLLPFLDHYRRLGVDHFFAIDNQSTDDTESLLRKQSDVHYFFTDESFAESASGVTWIAELATHYANGRWCLVVDADELVIFPGSEFLTFRDLVAYLDNRNQQCMFTVMLDMYAKRLSDAVPTADKSLLEVCPFFETETYVLENAQKFPPVQVYGGPRMRLFWSEGTSNPPAMRKTPLVRWSGSVQYLHTNHSLHALPLSDVVGTTLHFKFLADFGKSAAHEVERDDRLIKDHYQRYASVMKESDDIDFYCKDSLPYRDTWDLVRRGAMTCSLEFIRFAARRVEKRFGVDEAQRFERNAIDSLEQSLENSKLRLQHLPMIWRIVQPPHANPLLSAKVSADRLQEEVDGLKKKYKARLKELDNAKRQIREMLRSKSWRVTAPLRILTHRFSRSRR